uniref:Autophagy-related protein n=1 Tax=Lotharella globosa TaxID=91324 RepID=A0A7S4DYP1_9EUKA
MSAQQENKRKPYRELYNAEQRSAESVRIRMKYPDRVPIICERFENSKSIKQIDKVKFLVPSDLTVGQFQFVIRKRLALTPDQAMFLFAGGKPAVLKNTMAMVYKAHKDADGFLYMQYAGEKTFG